MVASDDEKKASSSSRKSAAHAANAQVSSADVTADPNMPPGLVIVPSHKDVPQGARWILARSGQWQFVHQQYQFAIRKPDGTPLMREDIQYDMMAAVFADTQAVFTDPTREGIPASPNKLTWSQLYIKEVVNSPRCAKSHREAMSRNPDYARDYAMMCLLVNVGRCNTTLAFYPEMRTSMRSYHPVPPLQRTGQNLQDAPRMKNMLKYCYESVEPATTVPSAPHELKNRIRAGNVPSTNIANLLFVLNGNATNISRQHFQTNPPLGFHDLFVPVNLCSKDRARVFLWLMFNYLESGENPFSPPGWAEKHPDIVPPMRMLTQQEMEAENVDPPEELELARQLTENRQNFLKGHAEEEAQKKAALEARAAVTAIDANTTETAEDARRNRKRRLPEEGDEKTKAPKKMKNGNGNGNGKVKNAGDSKASTPAPGAIPSSALSTPAPPARNVDDRDPNELSDPEYPPPSKQHRHRESVRHERTMLQQAFYIVQSHDALYDSANEDDDDYVQADLQQRLRILERIMAPQPVSARKRLRDDEVVSAYDSDDDMARGQQREAVYADEPERGRRGRSWAERELEASAA